MTWWEIILAVVVGIPVLWMYFYTAAHAIGYGFATGKLRAIAVHFLKNPKSDQSQNRTEKD